MKILFGLLLFFISVFCSGQPKPCSFIEDVSFTVDTLGVNSIASDFGPSVVKNELWFSAFNQKNIKKINQDINSRVFYDLYSAEIKSDGKVWSNLKLQGDLSEGFHEGPVSYCEKTGEFFVTLSNSINPEIKTVWIKQDKKPG